MTDLNAFAVGSAGSYISGTALVVDGANYLYKKPDVPVDVVLKASRGKAHGHGMTKHCMICKLSNVERS